MLFDLHTEKPAALWMKNTLIPLDLLFFDKYGVIVIVCIAPNAKPLSLEPIGTHELVRAVLEIRGGRAAEAGLVPGDLSEDKIFAHVRP